MATHSWVTILAAVAAEIERTRQVNPLGLLFAAAGAFSLTAAACDWEWLMNARKARVMVSLSTHNGARVFHGILGLALLAFGILAAIGVIDLS